MIDCKICNYSREISWLQKEYICKNRNSQFYNKKISLKDNNYKFLKFIKCIKIDKEDKERIYGILITIFVFSIPFICGFIFGKSIGAQVAIAEFIILMILMFDAM